MARFKFEDYDEYEAMYDDLLEEKRNTKLHTKGSKKGKTKGKGHQSVHNKKAEMHQEFLDSFEEKWEEIPKFIQPKPLDKNQNENKVKFSKKSEIPSQKTAFTPQENKPAQTFGDNSHEVKGNMIDFDRVDNIEKVENAYNGRQTYGIKFLFSGKKGLSKTVWFNQNVRERDAIFNREFGFWKNLQNKKDL